MTYDPSKLMLVSQGIARGSVWNYEDTGGETGAVYQGAGWFTDAKKKGVDTGDLITVRNRASNDVYWGSFTTVQDTGETQGTVTFDTD